MDNGQDSGLDAPQDGVPIAEAARRLGTNVDAVRKRIRRGSLTAHKQGDRWLVVLPTGQDAAELGLDSNQDPARTANLERELEHTRALLTEVRGERDFLRQQVADAAEERRRLQASLLAAQLSTPPSLPAPSEPAAVDVTPMQDVPTPERSVDQDPATGDATDGGRTWISSPAPLRGAAHEDETSAQAIRRPWWRFWGD
jgi:hypothetical protein